MTKLEQFDASLDETGTPHPYIAGVSFAPSRILRELEPIAYRVGFHDWLDAQGERAEEAASADGSFDRLP